MPRRPTISPAQMRALNLIRSGLYHIDESTGSARHIHHRQQSAPVIRPNTLTTVIENGLVQRCSPCDTKLECTRKGNALCAPMVKLPRPQPILDRVSAEERDRAQTLLATVREPATPRFASWLASVLTDEPPRAVRARGFTPLQTLALTVLLVNSRVVDHQANLADRYGLADTVDRLDTRLRGVFETQRQAVFAAVRQIGRIPHDQIPEELQHVLGSRSAQIDQDSLDSFAAVIEANWGWYALRSPLLGWILIHSGH